MRENDENFKKKMYNFYDKEFIKKTMKESEFSNVMLSDPLGEYKHFEKLASEEQKRYENKIQNKDNRLEDDKSTKTGGLLKKKKQVFDDYAEIFKILYKNKIERQKENENSGKNTEDQNQCIKMFVEGRDARPKGDMKLLGKRESSHSEINNPAFYHITMKHLIFYLENDPEYSNSKYLFKAFMNR